jgi:gamma-glutamyltranspeptidase/glutathione hydrolase
MERDFQLPGRSAALGTRCMAATSHPLGTATALEILRAGGNAVDAAVAAAAVLGVVEPSQTGIGGDCFVLYMPKGSGAVHALNGSGWSPQAASTDGFLGRHITAIEGTSPHAVTVPGCVAAWERLLRDFGTIGLDRALAPAIRAAEDGYPVTERVAHDWRGQVHKLAARPGSAEIFLDRGAAPASGAVHRQPRLARTLRAIARDGAEVFYRGWIAADIVECLRALGGLHSAEDFALFEPEYVQPIRARYRDADIWECPPNGQGLIALVMARMLQRFDVAALQPGGAEKLHLLAEVGRLAYDLRDAVIADPRGGEVPVERLLGDEHIDALVRRIFLSGRIDELGCRPSPEHRDTVFLTVIDRDMNTIALINSIFDEFGSGIVAPRSGILLHSRGSGFVVERGHPNTIEGRKRPLHTIIPALLTRDGRVALSFGVTGGHFQPLGQMQLLTNIIDHGMSLQQAIDAPRIFARGDQFEAERTIAAPALAALAGLGHRISVAAEPLGTAQAISVDWNAGVLHGGADGRRDGVALGW